MDLVTRRPVATRGQDLTRIVLGVFLALAGLAHLTVGREDFRAQVPSWVPVDEDLVVLGSGVAELALGAALLVLPQQRRLVGLVVAAFFVAVFPGNVAQYVERVDAFGLDTDTARLVRLFFQPVLVGVALYAAGLPERRRARDEPDRSERG